jgi:hypothetical protein
LAAIHRPWFLLGRDKLQMPKVKLRVRYRYDRSTAHVRALKLMSKNVFKICYKHFMGWMGWVVWVVQPRSITLGFDGTLPRYNSRLMMFPGLHWLAFVPQNISNCRSSHTLEYILLAALQDSRTPMFPWAPPHIFDHIEVTMLCFQSCLICCSLKLISERIFHCQTCHFAAKICQWWSLNIRSFGKEFLSCIVQPLCKHCLQSQSKSSWTTRWG